MGYISKYDNKFINFINRKYAKYNTEFRYFDDYIVWLYYKFCMCNEEFYYKKLEDDIWQYSDWQTGSPRENEKKDNNWKELEKDKFNLYNSDDYVEYLKLKRKNDEENRARTSKKNY